MLEIECTWQLAIGSIAVLVTTYLLYIRWVRSHYPPGPWPLPIIGNLHLLSRSPHINLLTLAEKYGPVFTMWMGAKPAIVVSNLDLYMEAVTRKGTDFSGKAFRGKFMTAVTHQNEDIVTRAYDEKVEIMRKMIIKCMRSGVLTKASIHSIVTREVRELLKRLASAKGRPLDSESSFNDFVIRVVGRVAMSLDYEDCEEWRKIGTILRIGVQKSTIASFYPIFWYLQPGITKILNELISSIDTFLETRLRKHEETYCEGELRDLMDVAIKDKRHLKETDENNRITRTNMCLLMLDAMGAGDVTVLNTMQWSVLHLLKRPDIQKKIQRELDDLALKKIGKEKVQMIENGKPFIEMSDKNDLPYLQAFIYESMRVSPAPTLSFPYKTIRDTSLGKYPVPEDTAVIYNYYAINRDRDFWEKPSEICPERFIAEDGNFDLSKVKNMVTFGQGKRSCVGEQLAKTELILFMSNLLLNYKLTCPSVASLPTFDEGVIGVTFQPKMFDIIFNERK